MKPALLRSLRVATFCAVVVCSGQVSAEERAPDAFLAQLGVGSGFSRYYEKAKARRWSETKIRSRSASAALDLYLGGAVVSGFVVGVGVVGRSMLDPSIKVNGVLYESTSATLGLTALNLFSQYHPDWLPPGYGQLYLRLQGGISESTVQFQHVALARERQLGPMLGGALGYSFARADRFHFSAEATLLGTRLTARDGSAHVRTTWYCGTYGLTVSYY